MRKRKKINFNSEFDSQFPFAQEPSFGLSADVFGSPEAETGADFQSLPLVDSKKKFRIRFSHILFSLLFIVLISSNLVASRIVNNTLTWFVLAFSFVTFLFLVFFVLRFLYRLGHKKIATFLLLPVIIAGSFFGSNVLAVINDPGIDEALVVLMPSKPQYVFYIRAKNGQMLATYEESERFVPPVEMWDSWFSRATIAIEDERFETRFEGVIDVQAVIRAVVKNLWKWNIEEGASGIEIQTGKLLTGHFKTKSFLQKAGQGLIALRLDQRFPYPEEKFCLYGNIVYLVNGKRGVGAAASDLFGVSDLRQLSISQGAVLAAMLKNSSIWNPRTNLEKSRERRDVVLKKMLELKFISEEQFKLALKEEIKLVPRIKPNELFIRAAINLHSLEKEQRQ